MPVRQLPSSPNLEHLKYQAQDLRRAHAARALDAAQRLREFHPRFGERSDEQIFAAKIALSDAQLAIAREYGFASWPRLKKYVETLSGAGANDLPYHERIADPIFRRAVDLIDRGDAGGLRQLLKEHPKLIHQRVEFEGGNYFQKPGLLEFVAENPVRHGSVARNVVDVVQVLLDAGASTESKDETLLLVATGRVVRECKVQEPLIGLLVENGADKERAALGAALHGEFDAVRSLLRLGANYSLPLSAAMGALPEFSRRLPMVGAHERHLALGLAARNGHAEIVRQLLDAGEDPNRYNAKGGHSHSTPLHQAAFAGHFDVVKLLLERGARRDIRDILWGGTAADWAAHAKHFEIEKYLRAGEGDAGAIGPSS